MARRKKLQVEEKKERRLPTTRYNPEYKKGLTSQQVQEHRLHGWTNKAVEPPSKTTKEIVHENVFTYFNLIFVVIALSCGIFQRFDISSGYYCKYIDWNYSGD